MSIPDRESWLLRHGYPTGYARGWRRTGCLVVLVAALVLLILAGLIAALA